MASQAEPSSKEPIHSCCCCCFDIITRPPARASKSLLPSYSPPAFQMEWLCCIALPIGWMHYYILSTHSLSQSVSWWRWWKERTQADCSLSLSHSLAQYLCDSIIILNAFTRISSCCCPLFLPPLLFLLLSPPYILFKKADINNTLLSSPIIHSFIHSLYIVLCRPKSKVIYLHSAVKYFFLFHTGRNSFQILS